MAAAFIAAGTGIAALAAGGGYIQMESGKKENQVRISLDFSGDRRSGNTWRILGLSRWIWPWRPRNRKISPRQSLPLKPVSRRIRM